mmetsp:Transcript_55628/g.90112  ORF Transcript_55628/g.90112 Transcript_55628/m.90112 type:complete len:85 (+) Transcript_55628:342-596(+)
MRFRVVMGMQNDILIGIKKQPLHVSFQIFKWKKTWNSSLMIPIKISVCALMTILQHLPRNGLFLRLRRLPLLNAMKQSWKHLDR